MEELREALASRNIVVWIILIVVFVLFLKFLKNAGKFFIMLVLLIIIALILHKFAPGVIDPVIDFVKGGWLGDQRP